MRRDIKTGMLIGLVLVIAGVIVISTWPGGTVEERLMESGRYDEVTDVESKQAEDAGGPVNTEESSLDASELIKRAAEHVVEESANRPGEAGPRIHIVRDGESLSEIAELHYGDESKWPLIAEANKNVVKDVNKVSPGMRLVIPKP